MFLKNTAIFYLCIYFDWSVQLKWAFPKIEIWRLQKTTGNHSNEHYFTRSICLVINKLKYLYLKNYPGYLGNVLGMKVTSGFLGCWLSVFSLYFVAVYFPCASSFLVFASVCVHYVQSASRLMSCSSCLHNKHPQPACESCVWVHSSPHPHSERETLKIKVKKWRDSLAPFAEISLQQVKMVFSSLYSPLVLVCMTVLEHAKETIDSTLSASPARFGPRHHWAPGQSDVHWMDWDMDLGQGSMGGCKWY